MTATSYLGKPTSRVEGRAKVTGIAKYAAEYNVADVAHGVVVSSAIAKGRSSIPGWSAPRRVRWGCFSALPKGCGTTMRRSKLG